MFQENDTLELKKSLAQLREGIISLSAMLNKSNKGEVYFGINDDKKVVGLSIGKKTLSDVTNEIHNNLKPLPSNLIVKTIEIEGKEVVYVSATGPDTPYQAYGRYYIRVNDSDIIMNASMLEGYFKRKDNTYLRWENEKTIYTIDDISEDILIDMFRKANDNGRLDYVYKNRLDALTRLGLITSDGHLNNAGWYLFGNNKPITIKLATYPTDDRIEFGQIKEISGNIFELIDETINYILNHITFKSVINGYIRTDVPEIPIKAIREIVVNSFAHKSYEIIEDTNTYTIFKSSVRIYNPGSIYDNIDPYLFATGVVGSKIRNILICQVLYKAGLIDSFGTGFDRTFTLCARENIKYRYYNDNYGFTFIFYRNPNVLTDNPCTYKANNNEENILSLISQNKFITIPELATTLDISESTIFRTIKVLTEKGIVRRVGSRKSGYWEYNRY